MRKYILTTTCLLVFSFLLYQFVFTKNKPFKHREIIDAVHEKAINTLFQEADAYKYAQNYPKAIIEFQKIVSKKGVSISERQYALNQLAFIHLTMNEDSLAHTWLEKLDKEYPSVFRAIWKPKPTIFTISAPGQVILLSLKWLMNTCINP
ncbi:MAG: hypothetical protein HC817_13105 [Saprospiraceae bacterium]|nr:hypothetical protein [Saprospiraceae bacterium]